MYYRMHLLEKKNSFQLKTIKYVYILILDIFPASLINVK